MIYALLVIAYLLCGALLFLGLARRDSIDERLLGVALRDCLLWWPYLMAGFAVDALLEWHNQPTRESFVFSRLARLLRRSVQRNRPSSPPI